MVAWPRWQPSKLPSAITGERKGRSPLFGWRTTRIPGGGRVSAAGSPSPSFARSSPQGSRRRCHRRSRASGAEAAELRLRLLGFRGAGMIGDQLLQDQARIDLVAEVGEGVRLAEQCRRDASALRPRHQDLVVGEDRLVVLALGEVGLADPVLGGRNGLARRVLADESPQRLYGAAVVAALVALEPLAVVSVVALRTGGPHVGARW